MPGSIPIIAKAVRRSYKISTMPHSLALPACLIAGLFANLAFAPFNFWPAYLLAMLFMVRMMDGAANSAKPVWSAFFRGGMFGTGFFSFGLHWIANAFLLDREVYGHMVWLVGILIIGLAALMGIAFAIVIKFWSRGIGRLPLFVLAIMGAETMRGTVIFGGLPWNIPGMIWAPGSAMSQTASLIGVWGLSAMTVFLFAAPACISFANEAGKHNSASVQRILFCVLIAATPGVMWGWGAQRLQHAPPPDFENAPIVRIIEVGVPQKDKYVPSNADTILKYYMDLTGAKRPEDPNDPDIIIWPEVATPHLLLQSTRALDPVARLLGDRFLIAGSVRTEASEQNEPIWYNSLAVITGSSQRRGPLAIYDKYRLVPFGEYVPFAKLAALLGVSSIQYIAKNGFRPGLKPSKIALGEHPAFTPLICYEALFPGLTPRGENRPDWLVNISIDTWFGQLTGPVQHFAHARYRAIEEGIPIARSASGGYSAMIDAFGRVTAMAEKISVKGNASLAWTANAVDAILPKALESTGFVLGWNRGFVFVFTLFNLWLFVSARQ